MALEYERLHEIEALIRLVSVDNSAMTEVQAELRSEDPAALWLSLVALQELNGEFRREGLEKHGSVAHARYPDFSKTIPDPGSQGPPGKPRWMFLEGHSLWTRGSSLAWRRSARSWLPVLPWWIEGVLSLSLSLCLP